MITIRRSFLPGNREHSALAVDVDMEYPYATSYTPSRDGTSSCAFIAVASSEAPAVTAVGSRAAKPATV